MFKQFYILLLICIAFKVGASTRTYPVFKAKSPITIDGNLNDKGWNGAPWGKYFFPLGNKAVADIQQTEFKILHDKQNMYFAVKANEKFMNKLKVVKENGESVWSDDAIEFYLQPGRNSKFKRVAVNAAGNLSDTHMQAKARHYDGYYTLEIKIPFTVFRYDSKKRLFANFARHCTTDRHSKYSCWAPCNVLFKETANFAELIIINDDASVYQIEQIQTFVNAVLSFRFLSKAKEQNVFYDKLIQAARGRQQDNESSKRIIRKWQALLDNADYYLNLDKMLAGNVYKTAFWLQETFSFVIEKCNANPLELLLPLQLTDTEEKLYYKLRLDALITNTSNRK